MILLGVAIGGTATVMAQTPEAPKIEDLTGTEADVSFAPSPAYPNGRMNPDAPPEVAQFAFMVGEFDCVDEIRQGDGSWIRLRAIWNAHWFLNGYGIQDEYWTPRFFTSNIRIFDPASGKWQVTFFRMPGYQSSVWEGVKEGDTMVMRQGATTGPGLTFYNISEAGFDWNSGGKTPGWKSSCKRRRHP